MALEQRPDPRRRLRGVVERLRTTVRRPRPAQPAGPARRLRADGAREPFILYTSARAAKAQNQVETAQGVTADPDQLVAMVIAAAG